jgi:hypothetical protein
LYREEDGESPSNIKAKIEMATPLRLGRKRNNIVKGGGEREVGFEATTN